jgi:hypothetical protein
MQLFQAPLFRISDTDLERAGNDDLLRPRYGRRARRGTTTRYGHRRASEAPSSAIGNSQPSHADHVRVDDAA